MLWGVLGDIHSNVEALDAVLRSLEDTGVEGFICCGDLVGYGTDANAVIERVAALPRVEAVRGNHDLAVLGRMDLKWFNIPARAAVKRTRRTIWPGNLAWLKDLPERVENDAFTLVHGSPRNPAEEYLVTTQQFHDNCSYFDTSPWYGNTKSEHRVGHFLRQKPRQDFVITTKVGRVFHRPEQPDGFDSSPLMKRWRGGLPFDLRFDYTRDGILRSYEDSLMRLGLHDRRPWESNPPV